MLGIVEDGREGCVKGAATTWFGSTCYLPTISTYIDPLENLKSHIVNEHMRKEGYTVMVAQRMEILCAIAMNRIRN